MVSPGSLVWDMNLQSTIMSELQVEFLNFIIPEERKFVEHVFVWSFPKNTKLFKDV